MLRKSSFTFIRFSRLDTAVKPTIPSLFSTPPNPYHSQFDRHSMDYNKSKLDLVDSIITDETLRNHLFKYKTRDFVSNNHTEAEAKEILNYYLARSTNEEDKKGMKDLVSSLKLLRQGNPIPDLAIINYDDIE